MRPQLKKSLLAATKKFKSKKILVIGDLMLDLYIEGSPHSISQEAPVIVVKAKRKFYKLGGAANAAENVKALGGKVYLTGVIGEQIKHEDFGRSFLQTIKKSNISKEGIFLDSTRPTTLKMRVLSQGQQIVRIDEEVTKKINTLIEKKLIQYSKKILPEIDTVLISDYGKGVITENIMAFLTKEVRKLGKNIIVDAKPQNKDLYKGVDFITPNDIELSKMFNKFEVDSNKIISLAKKLKKDLKISNVLVTRGPDGMDLIDHNNKVHHIPTLSKNVIDVSGAGDTVASLISMGINDLTQYQLCYLAAIAAKVSVEKQGTSTVSLKELTDQIQ